jgi:elongation factor G
MILSDPIVTVGEEARAFLGVHESKPEEEIMLHDDLFKALVLGCQGALKRGPLSSYPMANMRCHVVNVDAEDGVTALEAMPGALRAAAANAVSSILTDSKSSCSVLEPTMSVEVTLPGDMVGPVLSDLTGRRGTVGDVLMGDEGGQALHAKALIRGDVPLVEILGYANILRSLTGGEGAFTAEYKGHSPCDGM